MGLSAEDNKWDFYVSMRCLRSGVEARTRCAGYLTALAYARQREQMGYYQVRILARRADRHKERLPRVLDSSLYGQHLCRGNGY